MAHEASDYVGPNGLLRKPPDFSLVLGGPLFQLLRRAHLADDALMMVRQRALVIALLAWLPLLALSAVEGRLLDGSVAVPFLLDADVHIRFLLAMPLLIVAVLAVAHGTLLAGQLANRIFFVGARLTQYYIEIAVMVAFLLCAFLGPLLVFAFQLAQAKRTGLREYGTLAERYVREFDAKWLRGGAPAGESFVGSADIQSLADLGNGYEVVRTVRIAPITKEAIVRLAAATVAPILPLALTTMPLEQLLKMLVGILF